MAEIICSQCGYSNEEGSTVCFICDNPLTPSEQTGKVTEKPVEKSEKTVQNSPEKDSGYYVYCTESGTKTKVENENVTEFFCTGCQKTHIVDGFIWSIEKEETLQKETRSDDGDFTETCAKKVTDGKLHLEEQYSHFTIEIDRDGGTLGRYGKYGADFFQSRNMLTVSGEHCYITYELGNWVIRHISHTNKTKYNGMTLESNQPVMLSDGGKLVLADTVTFIVHIGE